jgi:hypothetical protein
MSLDVTFFQSLLLSILPRCSSQARDIYVAAVVHTLHLIWLSRNTLRFSLNKAPLHATQVRLHASISMSDNISGGKCIAVDAKLLDYFSVSLHNRQLRDVFLVSWK